MSLRQFLAVAALVVVGVLAWDLLRPQAADSAARSMAPPPLVWTVSICTSRWTAEATALAAVFGMS